MEPFTLKWAAETLGANVIGAAEGRVENVCTDTRQIAKGALFFALQGEQLDGHAYVAQAFANGAVGAVVSQEVEGVSGPLFIVPDTLRALGDLAAAYRRQFAIPIVGVTGSIGKTSTKEMIAAVLRTRYNTLANEKNYNNEIGVPLTLFQLTEGHEVAVIEMGMRAMGEIDRLAEIAQPTIGLITNIGFAHIERLGSQESITQAKAELLARLPKDGVAILPQHDAFFQILASAVPEGVRLVRYSTDPNSDAEVRLLVSDAANQRYKVAIGGDNFDLTLRAPGTHQIKNALAALAVAQTLSVPIPQALTSLEHWEGAAGRLSLKHTPDGFLLLDDCYNAGPESMAAALETLAQRGKTTTAILGDMRELGDFAPEAHRFVGRKVVENGVTQLITVGELAEEIAAEATRHAASLGKTPPEIRRFAMTEEAANAVHEFKMTGDAILVKGSRAMQMEKIVAALMGAEEAGPHG